MTADRFDWDRPNGESNVETTQQRPQTRNRPDTSPTSDVYSSPPPVPALDQREAAPPPTTSMAASPPPTASYQRPPEPSAAAPQSYRYSEPPSAATPPGRPTPPGRQAPGRPTPSGGQGSLGLQDRFLNRPGGRAESGGGRGKRQPSAKQIERAKAREARWENNRYAVPYRTDGPKVLLGVTWFLGLLAAILLGEYAESAIVTVAGLGLIVVPVAAVAGLQTGFAWFPNLPATRTWTAATAAATAFCGMFGPWGALIGLLAGLAVIMTYVALYKGHRRSPTQLMDVLARSGLAAGLGLGSLMAIGTISVGAVVSLILLISAYEVGDYLVGTGASNAFEGPMGGFVGVGAIAFLLFLFQPEPFGSTSMLVFSLVAAICAPLGQLFASLMLPRGSAWAPALRRADSYLLAAPLWLVLLSFL